MKSVKLMFVSAMTGFALLALPLGLAAQQQQENQQQQPRLTITDNSESRYSTTTSVAPQDRVDGGPTGRFQSCTTTDGTVDYLKEQLSGEPDFLLRGLCEVGSSHTLTGSCDAVFIRPCASHYDPRQCPPGAKQIGQGFICEPVKEVDTGRHCQFTR